MENFQLYFNSLHSVFCLGCDDDDGHKTNCDPVNRIGAMDKDGTKSTARDPRACAGHDGVHRWLCI